MKELIQRAEAEIEIKKSRFIAIAIPTATLEEVKEHVKAVRAEHMKATHVVHAAVVGKSGSLYSSSDDREPKNTAGRPALEVLKGSGITNITVCIVRYFGGTLLGTGGLVKAYGDSVKAVLECVKTEELKEKKKIALTFAYNYYTKIKRTAEKHSALITDEDFSTDVKIVLTVDEDKADSLIKDLQNDDPYLSYEYL